MDAPTIYRPAPGVLFRELEGESVLLDLDSGRYFSLNLVASAAWRRLEEGATDAEGLVAAVLDGFIADDEAVVRKDIDEMLTRLVGMGLIEVIA